MNVLLLNVPLSVRRAAAVLGSTVAGGALGYGILHVFGQALAGHLPAYVKPTGPDGDGFGSMFAMLMNIGYNLGLVVGVLMTAAVLGGLAAGMTLTRRIR